MKYRSSHGRADLFAYFNPFATDRGRELKEQLDFRAAIAGMEEMWSAQPRTRFVHTESLINVLAAPDRPTG